MRTPSCDDIIVTPDILLMKKRSSLELAQSQMGHFRNMLAIERASPSNANGYGGGMTLTQPNQTDTHGDDEVINTLSDSTSH